MPIIKDGQTPEGRVIKCRKSVESTTPCVTRMMTEEERAFYGDPVPPKKWGKPPQKSEYWTGRQRMVMTFIDDDDFRRKMKRERLRKNLTQARLASFCDMSRDVLSKIERGNKPLTAKAKEKICAAFGWEEGGE